MPASTNHLVIKCREGFRKMNHRCLSFGSRGRVVTYALATVLATGVGMSLLIGSVVHGENRVPDSHDATPLTIPAPVNLATPFTKIAKQVGPAVVNINTEILPHRKNTMVAQNDDNDGSDANPGPDNPGPDNSGPDNDMQNFFNRFFGGTGPNMGQQNPQQQEERALGSGFIVDPNGYIVTNDHVIDKADRIYVKLATDPTGDQGHRATVIGVDKETDLAVIKINVGHPLPTVQLGNSDGAQVGDSVEAIGSPFDLAQTVTAGIVSAKNRNVAGGVGGVGGQFKHYIQTDAAINPGNSGGPLLNMDGQVIGVNTAIITQSNGYMGIGFAMPSNTVIDVYNQLIGPQHKVVRGSIGIRYQPSINSAIAKMYDADTGVLISDVVPGDAADKAGLKANDVIVSVDGKPIKNGDDLVDNISSRRPGTTVTIGYLRDGQKRTTTCTIENRADTVNSINGKSDGGSGGGTAANPSKTKLGLSVSDLPQNAPSNLHGVMIQSVTPGSFADELNPPVGPGVVIEGINRTPIKSKEDFDAIVSRLKSGDDVVLRVVYPNNGTQTTLTGGTLP